MKQIITITLLIWILTSQASDNDKRPSWSQGLPEKQDAPEFNKPDFEMDSMEIERPTFETDLTKPQIDYSEELDVTAIQSDRPSEQTTTLETEEVAVSTPSQQQALVTNLGGTDEPEQQTEPVIEEQTLVADKSQTAAGEMQDSKSIEAESVQQSSETQNKQQGKFYSWEITRQLPIEVSSRLFDEQSSVLLKIFINSKGDVIAVEPVLNDTPESLVSQAERSIKRWKFVSPQSLGFKQQVMSRVFKVALSEKS